jgi:hypothetical protein
MYLVVRVRLHAVGLAVDPDGLIVLVWHGAYSTTEKLFVLGGTSQIT